MRQTFLFIIVLTLAIGQVCAQSTIEYRMVTDRRTTPFQKYRNCIITELKMHQFDGKYELATEMQLGVIGNDYDKPMKIGKAPAEGALNKNVWFPVDGFKRTFVGRHIVIFSMDLNSGSGGTIDHDDDWNVRLEVPLTNRLLRDNKELFEKYYFGDSVQYQLLNILKYPPNIINGEIDIKQANKVDLMEFDNKSPKVYIDHAGIYGPWVLDIGFRSGFLTVTNPFLGAHGVFNEIHPMEQLWWTEKYKNGRIYHLNMSNDNSGRYNSPSKFDTDGGKLEHFNWQSNPMSHVFYIPFNIPLNSEAVQFRCSQVSIDNLTQSYNDGLEHHLLFRNRKLITIKEPPGDIIKIDFINTGIDPVSLLGNYRDTLIKGFIRIESSIGKSNGDYAGNLFLKLIEENPNLKLPGKCKVSVTLNSIKCVSVDDGDPQEDLMGFIGVRTESDAFYPLLSNHLPDDEQSSLLWSRLDGESQKLSKGETLVINKSFKYSLPEKGSSITLIADLEEDDGNGDGNKSALDDDDDRLEAKFDINDADGGTVEHGVVFKPIKVKNLELNRPITRTMCFGSGGSKFEINFTIELINRSQN